MRASAQPISDGDRGDGFAQPQSGPARSEKKVIGRFSPVSTVALQWAAGLRDILGSFDEEIPKAATEVK